jgi:hypothetical protein
MRFFRTHFFQRTVTTILVAGLGLGLFSGRAHAEPDASGYTAWISLHVPGSIPDSVGHALEKAELAQPRSLDEFLDVFFDEIESAKSGSEFMDWLYGESSEHSLLRQDLRFRLLNVVSSGILWRSVDVSVGTVLTSGQRDIRASGDSQAARPQSHMPTGHMDALQADRNLNASYLINVARPQGP